MFVDILNDSVQCLQDTQGSIDHGSLLVQGGVLSEDIVQPAMLRGPLVAGAARTSQQPAHSVPVKKQQNISVIKTEGLGIICSELNESRSYDDLTHAHTHACSGDGVDTLRSICVQCIKVD